MPDIWNLCEPCGRWFYCPTVDTVSTTAVCPVCAEPATRCTDMAAAQEAPQEPVA